MCAHGSEVVLHLTGEHAEAFALAVDGRTSVPVHLQHAMAGLVELGVVHSDTWSRRRVLQLGGTAAAAAVATLALPGVAAASSSTTPPATTSIPATTAPPTTTGTPTTTAPPTTTGTPTTTLALTYLIVAGGGGGGNSELGPAGGSDGGSGVVILAFPIPTVPGSVTGSGGASTFDSGGMRYHVFSTVGTSTFTVS